jgi:hypothetical protein
VPLNNLALALKAIKRVIMFLTATSMAVLHQVIAHFVTVYVVFITHFVAPLILLIANLMSALIALVTHLVAMLAARIIASQLLSVPAFLILIIKHPFLPRYSRG